jgi:methionine sulfoxide reductase heme-binding subunit
MPTAGTASAATGVIAMVLLTVVVVLGILVNRHGRLPGLARTAGLSLHRFTALLAVGFLAIHIVTAIAAPYAGIRLVAAIIPFSSAIQRGWLGLGAVATDLMVALIVTSLLRRHIGRRTWRAVHWIAYACWPAAFAHSIGTGGGMRAGRLLDLAIACAVAVLVAAGWRVVGSRRSAPAPRPGPPPRPGTAPVSAGTGDVFGPPSRRRLAVNPIACTGHGLCAELLPELITLDQWGYPLLADQPVPAALARRARRTVTDCPALALRLTDAGPDPN